MHRKIVTGAMTALLLLNPLSAVAVSTTTSTQTGEVASNESTSNAVDESGTSESNTSETTSSTSTSETATSESQDDTAADHTATTDSSNTEETATSSDEEKTAKTATNPKIPDYDGSGTQVNVNDVAYFSQNLAQKYPLGIGTQFTAFAGNTIYFTGQNNRPNYDGTYSANTMNFDYWNANYYMHSDQYPNPSDWRYPFSYTYTDTNATEQTAPLSLIGNTYAPDSDGKKVLTSVQNFQDNQGFLFEGDSDEIAATTDDQNSHPAIDRTPVQNKVGDIPDFRDNLGVNESGALYSGAEYFSRSQGQLKTVSQFYQSFNADLPVVGNSSIDPTIEAAKYVQKEGWINEIQVEVPLIAGSSTNGLAIFDLSSQTLGGIRSNNAMRIQLDNVTADTPKADLPYIIFNWNDWTSLQWTFDKGNMTFVDGNGNSLGADFYKKMGSHIIHNFPSVSSGSTLDLGIGNVDYPFDGTMIVPNGSISLNSSNQSTQSFWGSLIAGENITLQMTITKEKAFGSVFDTENLPDFDEMLLKLAFDKEEVTAENNTAANSLKVYGSGSDFTVAFSKEDKPVSVTAKTDTDDKADDQISGINLREDTAFTVDTTGWAPGKYEIIGRITSWKDSNGNLVENTDQDKPVAKFTIIVPEAPAILSLDAVPDLNFGSFTLGKSQAGTTSELKDFNVKNAQTFDGNSTGLLKVTDSRNNSRGGNWSLNVAMTPFQSGAASETIDAQLNLNIQQDNQDTITSITVSSKEGTTPAFLLHKGGSEVSATENFRILTTADGKNSSTLQLIDPVTRLGTYHSTVTWTLGDLPKSDEVSKDK